MKRLLLLAAAYAVSVNAWGADAAAGKEKAKVCAACHGESGVSAAAEFPKIAGQHYDYMVRAMTDYKTGARKDPIMAAQVANLNRRDIQDLAAYFASQPGVVLKY